MFIHYFILITSLSSASESLHFFNTHSHIHEFLVLIAGATLLQCLIFTVCSLSWLTNTKVRYIVPPFRHIVCRLCILCTLASFSTDSPWHNTSFVCINTLFIYFYTNRFSVAINKHKGEYYCTIYFKIAVVNIVSSSALPYCCFIIWYYHKFIFSVRIITLFQ